MNYAYILVKAFSVEEWVSLTCYLLIAYKLRQYQGNQQYHDKNSLKRGYMRMYIFKGI